MTQAHGILGGVTVSLDPEVPPVRLPGQQELPCEDRAPMETERHRAQYTQLIDTLKHALRDRDDVYVSGNMFVYFSPRQLRNELFRGPDVFVVLGAEKKERLSWVLWEELRLPDVVIELTSPSTRDEDYGTKKDVYERVWKTAVYVIYDPITHQLDAWRLDGGRYVPATRTPEGDIEVSVLGMRLGLRSVPLDATVPAPSLRWIDESGAVLPNLLETSDALTAMRARHRGRGACGRRRGRARAPTEVTPLGASAPSMAIDLREAHAALEIAAADGTLLDRVRIFAQRVPHTGEPSASRASALCERLLDETQHDLDWRMGGH